MRVVVCDDDAVLRSVAAGLAIQAGHEVLAETDSGRDAVALVERFGAELLVLDMALPAMSGRDVLREIRHRHLDCDVVVFTAVDTDVDGLLAAGAREVVVKPDVMALAAALVIPVAPSTDGDRRRVAPPDGRPLRRPTVAEAGPSGVAPPSVVDGWVRSLVAGDAVLAVAVDHPEGAPPTVWGRLLVADRLLAAARTARLVLRAQDRVGLHEPAVAMAGDQAVLVGLLIGGGRAGAAAAFARLSAAHLGVDPAASLRGGWAVVADGRDPVDAVRAAVAGVTHAATVPAGGHRLLTG